MTELRSMDAFNEDVDRKRNNPTKLRKYLRQVISYARRRETSLLKNPKKEIVIFDPEDGPQPSTNKDEAKEMKKLRKKATKMLSGMGGGAITDLSQRTGATAKGTLFKKRMN